MVDDKKSVNGKTLDSANVLANSNINQLNNWSLANWLRLNDEKTSCTFFPVDNNYNIRININGLEIKKVASCRYLRVIPDAELKWSEHTVGLHVYKIIKVQQHNS